MTENAFINFYLLLKFLRTERLFYCQPTKKQKEDIRVETL